MIATQLRDYFDGVGYARWSAIYGDSDLSRVRRTIREGHAAMLAIAEGWLADRLPAGAHILDAGCGTGLFAVAMARRGFRVTAVDIAPKMVQATRQAAREAGVIERVSPGPGDIAAFDGTYDAVVCFDVLVHYPRAAFEPLLAHLAGQSRGPLIFTYAPYRPLLAALHWVGGRFPKGDRRTEIQMIPESAVVGTLSAAGKSVGRTASVSKGFYHVALLEAA